MNDRLGRFVVFAPSLFGAAVLAETWGSVTLPQAARVVAAAFLGFGFLVAAFGARPEVRSHATVALAAAGVTAAAQTRSGRTYVVLCIAFALVSVLAIRRGRGTPVPRYAGPRRALAVLPAVGATVAMSLALGLPPLARWVEQRVGVSAEGDDSCVGFSERLALGSMQRMLASNRIVLRVHGRRVAYLRGALLDRYEGRVWTSTLADRSMAPRPGVREDQTTSRAVFASGPATTKQLSMRWFLPPNACHLQTRGGRVLVDGMGIPTPESPDETTIGFSVCDEPQIAPPTPSSSDGHVPAHVRRRIELIAREWTQGASTDREKLDAISRELQRFSYALGVARDDRLDPVVDFLTKHQEGHCEMFASALALLARTEGVPTRLVVGYRVSEQSSLFDHDVVRERNAHTWVEAWIDGAWRMWDPTPAAELMVRTKPSPSDRLGEIAAYLWDKGLDEALGAAVLVAAFVYYGRQWLAGLLARARGRSSSRASSSLPALVSLETALAQAGHARPASEPLERFARRLAHLGEPWAGEVAEALGSYARLRYGGQGDEGEVIRSLERLTTTVARHGKSGAVA